LYKCRPVKTSDWRYKGLNELFGGSIAESYTVYKFMIRRMESSLYETFVFENVQTNELVACCTCALSFALGKTPVCYAVINEVRVKRSLRNDVQLTYVMAYNIVRHLQSNPDIAHAVLNATEWQTRLNKSVLLDMGFQENFFNGLLYKRKKDVW